MELLNHFKETGYYSSNLYYLVANKRLGGDHHEITPSVYLREVRMSTEDRLKALANIDVPNIVKPADKNPKECTLSITPRILIFQNFKPNDKIVAKFSVANVSKAPTYIHLSFKGNVNFQIKAVGGHLLSRLAPGISITFAVTFKPTQYQDYAHRVTFDTETETFVLPLIAMGPRPLFDFPDEVRIPETPLKVENSVTIPIHNIGVIPAGFTLETKCPFILHPMSAFLAPNETAVIKFGLKTMRMNEVKGVVRVYFETGEVFAIHVSSSTFTVKVELEKEVVRFVDTYNTMVRQQTLHIWNKSPHLLTYVCMKNEGVLYDFQDKLQLATLYYDLKTSESAKCRKLVEFEVLSSSEHERVYTRIFNDEIQSLVADETLMFQDMHFSVTPAKGNLWPNKSTELVITFSPKQIGEHHARVYLDIDGVLDRMQLALVGTALPPKILLNLETLDMDRVYINKAVSYEIVAMNKGYTNGEIVYKETPTLFGSVIQCSPERHCLRPGEKQIFVITFFNSNQGPYFEEVNFVISESDVVLRLYLKGEVIYPTLKFGTPCLAFGSVSIGIPKSLEIELINESEIDVSGSLKISSDGPEISSITIEDFEVAIQEGMRVLLPDWPMEFCIEPNKVELGPESTTFVKITLNANIPRTNETNLELELGTSDSPPIVLPITYDARTPEIVPAPEIKLRGCYLGYAYKTDITIVTKDFYGYFIVEEQENSLQIDFELKRGFIEPNATIVLPVSIITYTLGFQEHIVRLYVFGQPKPIDVCRVTGCGTRPIVTCTPTALHWGQVKMLHKTEKVLTLVNDSPVPVSYKSSLVNREGPWSIEPHEGVMLPESELQFKLTLYLVDAGTYNNKAIIQMEKVKDIFVPLTVTAVGSCIVVQNSQTTISLGRHFTRIPMSVTVLVENKGHRAHNLDWLEFYKTPKLKERNVIFFDLEPRVFRIAGGEKKELTITGMSYKACCMREMWYLVGNADGSNKKEMQLEMAVVADFVDPKIEISSSLVEFRYDHGAYNAYYKLLDIIKIRNVSKLPLDLNISIRPPFAIIHKEGTYRIPLLDEDACACVTYDGEELIKEKSGHELNFFEDIQRIKATYNLTYVVDERLEDREAMKLQLLFDITKHLNLRSKIYSDTMKVKFKHVKNKDQVKLVGKVNFPNLLVLTPRIDFHCVLNGSVTSKTIKIQNPTPLLAHYKLHWKKCRITSLVPPTLGMFSKTSKGFQSKALVEDTIRSELRAGSVHVSDVWSEDLPAEGSQTEELNTLSKDENFLTTKRKLMKKITPLLKQFIEIDNSEYDWTYKLPKPEKSSVSDINDILQLMPHKGQVHPNMTQYIHIIFRPDRDCDVRGSLEIDVLGGPSESIVVAGQSSDLRYALNTQKINCKIRSFQSKITEKLKLQNKAMLPFEYITYLNQPDFDNELKGAILEIVPPKKRIEGEEDTEINIVIRPGVVGFFDRVFILEVGHLPHIQIEVYGWGVIPQVFMTLPRPELYKLAPELGYHAIASLSTEYLSAVYEIFAKTVPEHVNSPLVEKCFEDPQFQEDWYICSSWDGYPTTMDIDLSVERLLVIHYIQSRPEIVAMYSNSSRTGSIPGLHTIPYVVDFGVVITGNTANRFAEIINYAPIAMKIHFAKCNKPQPWLVLRLCNRLNPGEKGKIEAVFAPTAAFFPELEQNVETTLYLEVPYGVIIPIVVKALCAVPYLETNVNKIDLGVVRCGDKTISAIPIKNVGKPVCVWFATLKLKTPGPNPLTILENSGKFEPEEGGWLRIAFKPTMEMTYEALLIFKFHMNQSKMTIPIVGHGICPRVDIIGSTVAFPPSLPWSEPTEIFFGMTNPCPFPIEIIVAHDDADWKKEEQIYQLLYKYYNKPEEMLVPAIVPGKGIPFEIENFYHELREDVARKMAEQAAALAKIQKSAHTSKKSRSPKSTPKSPPKSGAKGATVRGTASRDGSPKSPRAFRTEAELMAEELRKRKEDGVDPLQDSVRALGDKSTGGNAKRGLVLFMHAVPDKVLICQETAYALSKELGIPAMTFDLCIVDALCICTGQAKEQILSEINENFETLSKQNMDPNSITEESLRETDEEYDIIWKKIQFIATYKRLPSPKAKGKKDVHMAVSVPTLGPASGPATGCLFQMDSIQELLTEYFELQRYFYGFILDSLSSVVIKYPTTVLMTVLKAKRTIKNIHLVVYHSEFSKWVQLYEESFRELEQVEELVEPERTEDEITGIVTSLEEMNADEFDKAPADLKAVYIKYGLEERRTKFFSKKMEKMPPTPELKKDRNTRDLMKSKEQLGPGGDAPDTKKKPTKREAVKEFKVNKQTSEFITMSYKYNDFFKNTYDNLITICNNWLIEECELGAPLYTLNGHVVGDVKKKAIKKKSELTLQMDPIDPDRGFPLTIVTGPFQKQKKSLVANLANNYYIREALKKHTGVDVLTLPIQVQQYTVLLPKSFPVIIEEKPLEWCYLDEPPIKKCECNQADSLKLLDDTTQESVIRVLSQWHCVCGKKVQENQRSSTLASISDKTMNTVEEEEIEFPLPLERARSISSRPTRTLMYPGDLVRCKYRFRPQEEGSFNITRFVEVYGWPESRVEINISAVCDVPRLDSRPKKMFENFARRAFDDIVYKCTYLEDLKLFEFGPIFIGPRRIYEEEYDIDLRNSSLMTAEVNIEFFEETHVFQINKRYISLEPGARGSMTVSAAPASVGVHTATLLLCVKNNPDIVKVNIACSGVVPIVEVLPHTKVIDFGKQLLYRREDDRFIVKNDSILPIMWRIANPDEFKQNFIISQTQGIIPKQDNQVIPITYIACEVGIILNKPLVIEISDSQDRGDPMMSDTLYLSGECYDVMIDAAFENTKESFLNFGNVKVNSTAYQEMYLLNRGKFNVYFRLKKVRKFPEPSLLKTFEATPEYGMIPALEGLSTIDFACKPMTSVNLTNVPVYTCSILDGTKEQVVVAKFPISASIVSFYNTFTLFPLGELNFHILPVGTDATRDVILNNTSKCPFTYTIAVPPEYQTETPGVKVGKDNKIKGAPIKCGNFNIFREDALLPPGASRTIKIQLIAGEAKKYEETIHFVVSDTCPTEAKGVPLKLVGTGAVPVLDFWNIENTFKEHFIVKSLTESHIKESYPHCVFVEDTVSLHFNSVTVMSSHAARLHLYNHGLVTSVINAALVHNTNTKTNIFTLDKDNITIEPLMHKSLEIIFSPTALQEYRAVLVIKLKQVSNQEKIFNLCLIGEGSIPRIRIVSPKVGRSKTASLQFPVTCLGSITNKTIRVKNTSAVKAMAVFNLVQRREHRQDRLIYGMIATKECRHMVTVGNRGLDGLQSINLWSVCELRLARRHRTNDTLPDRAFSNYHIIFLFYFYTIQDDLNSNMIILLEIDKVATVNVCYNPLNKGKSSCEIQITIIDNPYEFYTITCHGEAFIEDVVLIGLEMLSMETDLEVFRAGSPTTGTLSIVTGSTAESSKKSKGGKDKKKTSKGMISLNTLNETSTLKYILNFGGCELCTIQKRSVIMANYSDKVYRFTWVDVDNINIRPSIGYISPAEEKDIEITFFSLQPVDIKKELIYCSLVAITDDALSIDLKGATWDNRQTRTSFDPYRELYERVETKTEEQIIPQSEYVSGNINMVIVYSVSTEYTKYKSNLPQRKKMKDTFIYQTRTFDFTVENTGNVPMKIVWSFHIEDVYPTRIDKPVNEPEEIVEIGTESIYGESLTNVEVIMQPPTDEGKPTDPAPYVEAEPITKQEPSPSKITLFGGSEGRDSVDTWFEMNLPFEIEPAMDCLKPRQKNVYKVTFSPMEAFNFIVKLRSDIENLDPYDQNISCRITAKSLIPYCHLDIEESKYFKSGKSKLIQKGALEHVSVLEYNVLGAGCYKKSFNLINPTEDGYEFVIELSQLEGQEFVPVHCDVLSNYVEGGSSSEVTFTFAPSAPGLYESLWNIKILGRPCELHLLVVGTVRVPEVMFVPSILLIRNSMVGYIASNMVALKNLENENLDFKFVGDSFSDETGLNPVKVVPEKGVLKPQSETPIEIIYTPVQDGPLSFKIFFAVKYGSKNIVLSVNALSHSIKSYVTYSIMNCKHALNDNNITNIHLEQCASDYERSIPFTIKNEGSATFFYEWRYNCSAVKKYLQVNIEPTNGHVSPGNEAECQLYFNLKQVPVHAFPVTLAITDGAEYKIYLYAEIEKPMYRFSCHDYDFGKCFVNVGDTTYKRNLTFTNESDFPLSLDNNFENTLDLFIEYTCDPAIEPRSKIKIPVYFRPKNVKKYEFKVQFSINSLIKEVVTIRGEGVHLLVDVYEGCQKSFDLGVVKVGKMITREIEIMNHSKVPVHASFEFQHMKSEPETNVSTISNATSLCLDVCNKQEAGPSRVKSMIEYNNAKTARQIEEDRKNSLSSLKVVPSTCIIKPHMKIPVKIQFKPQGLIGLLDVKMNLKAFEKVIHLINLRGCATSMELSLSQQSLQFGQVHKHGCKVLKVMLNNKGNSSARFLWAPLMTDVFTISPMKGVIAARSNVTFSIACRPLHQNPFIKVWASCIIEQCQTLEIALYATCIDCDVVENKNMHFECPVREVKTDHFNVTNPTDDVWHARSQMVSASFETLFKFDVQPFSSYEIPIHFKPKTIGTHEAEVVFSSLGEGALIVNLVGVALQPSPNGIINLSLVAKQWHTEELPVYNISEVVESYRVSTEILKIVPDKFSNNCEINHPAIVKVWGEATATCPWTIIFFEACEVQLKVMFSNKDTQEYQYYNVMATVKPNTVVDTLTFVARARESVHQQLVVVNPVARGEDFTFDCQRLECPEMVYIARSSQEKVTLTYSPLVVGTFYDTLTVNNKTIGTQTYSVVLQCLPGKEKNIECTTTLGSSTPIRIRVHNRTNSITIFTYTMSHPCIIPEKEYSLGPFEKGKFQFTFEPTEFGEQHCTITVNSPVAGSFVNQIKGRATKPRPQGPFEVKAGGHTAIRFKNVFLEERIFRLRIERGEDFFLKTDFEIIKPKKEIKILVYLNEKPLEGWITMPTSSLIIECHEPPDPDVHWTYFLRGIP